jgi:hypothetical protein
MAQYIVKNMLAGQKEQRIAFEKLFADEMAKKSDIWNYSNRLHSYFTFMCQCSRNILVLIERRPFASR